MTEAGGEVTPLIDVRKAARNACSAYVAHDRATQVLHSEIRKARITGVSLRAIALEAGVSYETVRRICE